MNIFEISGFAAILLVASAAVLPDIVAVPFLALTPIAICIWLVGECCPELTEKKKPLK